MEKTQQISKPKKKTNANWFKIPEEKSKKTHSEDKKINFNFNFNINVSKGFGEKTQYVLPEIKNSKVNIKNQLYQMNNVSQKTLKTIAKTFNSNLGVIGDSKEILKNKPKK